MWVVLSLKNMNDLTITYYILSIYNEFKKPILLSINSYKNINETYIDLYMSLRRLKEMGIPIIIGPQFLEEGFVINDKLEPLENMYFTTPGERIIWFLERTKDIIFDTIILYEDTLGIDPIILKKKKIDFEIYFRYNHSVIKDINKIINKKNYHFERINRENEYDYTSKRITK